MTGTEWHHEQEHFLRDRKINIAAEMEDGRLWSPKAAWIFEQLYELAHETGLWGQLDTRYDQQRAQS